MNYSKPKRPRGRRTDQAQFYMNLHPSCECCGVVEARELHHIVTRSTGGDEEEWNYLALCTVCHHEWHYIGRKSFAARHPALADKIKSAVIRQGRKW